MHLARERDFGHNDTQFITISHLGNLLKPGDLAKGYDLTSISFNDANLKSLQGRSLPDIVSFPLQFPLSYLLTIPETGVMS